MLDIHYRRHAGETPQAEDYLPRFPTLDRDWLVRQIATPMAEGSAAADRTLGITPSDTPAADSTLPRIRYIGRLRTARRDRPRRHGRGLQGPPGIAQPHGGGEDDPCRTSGHEADHDRFHAEAEAAAQLDHPNIVPIFEVGEHQGQHYFSMGYVDGRSLAARLAEGPLPPKEAAELVATVAEAVEYAHRQGVIHRDIKPSNILIDRQGPPAGDRFWPGQAGRGPGVTVAAAT